MAAEITYDKKGKPLGSMTLLSSAACEWFLIFLLFVDAAFSYLLTKFANYCELKTPCLLCSRPDLVIRDKKPRCYWSVLCSDHVGEISSLVSCSVHNKLADISGMCEECLMPIAMKNKSNSESYRLVVGKLLVDVERSVLQNLMLNKNIRLVSSGRRACSCCNKTWKAKSNAERLHELTSVGFGASKANVKPPLPRVPGRSRFSRRDSFKRLRDKFAGQVKNQPVGNKSVGSMSHVGYTKLNITSDSDSEVPLSDDDDYVKSGLHGINDNTKSSVPRTLTENVLSEKQAHQASEPITSLLDQSVLSDVRELKNKISVTSDELKLDQSHSKPNLSQMAELISFDDGFQLPAVEGVPFDASIERNKSNPSLSHMPALSVLSELLSLKNVPSSANIGTKQRNLADVAGTSYEENASVAGHIAGEIESSSEHVFVMNLTDASSPNDEGMGPIVVSDSTKIEEDTKSPQQVSSSDMGLMSKTTSPRAHSHLGAIPKCEDTSPRALLVSASLERHDSGCESLDGISVSEIEGESSVDRLKRQVEYDRSCMNALYKELEEERNAAAIAANEAMAMITRLQEEKAALHMEALQYLRMMEEQAEHDMEALEKANELLAEKEKEVQDLEADLEFYTSNFLNESTAKDPLKLERKNLIIENHDENSPASPSDSKSTEILKGIRKSELVNISILNFEDEKHYISECLKKLEEKLHQSASNGTSKGMPNGVNSESFTSKVDGLENLSVNGKTRLDEHNENNSLPLQKDVLGSNRSPAQDMPSDLVEDNHFVSETNATMDCDRGKLSMNRDQINSGTLEKGIAGLRDRLEALETDCDFLKHAFNMLQNGNDGLQFIHEIAHQLQELRKIEIKKRCISIP